MAQKRLREEKNRWWEYFPSEYGHMNEWHLYFDMGARIRLVATIMEIGTKGFLWVSYNMYHNAEGQKLSAVMKEIEDDYLGYLKRNFNPDVARRFSE